MPVRAHRSTFRRNGRPGGASGDATRAVRDAARRPRCSPRLPATSQAQIVVQDARAAEGAGLDHVHDHATGGIARSRGDRRVRGIATARPAHPPTTLAVGGNRTFPGALLAGRRTQAQTVTVPSIGDALDEADETFASSSAAPRSPTARASARSPTTTPRRWSASPTRPRPPRAPARAFTVALSAPSGRDVSVAYATADGERHRRRGLRRAQRPAHDPGGLDDRDASAWRSLDDGADEPDESFGLRLGAPSVRDARPRRRQRRRSSTTTSRRRRAAGAAAPAPGAGRRRHAASRRRRRSGVAAPRGAAAPARALQPAAAPPVDRPRDGLLPARAGPLQRARDDLQPPQPALEDQGAAPASAGSAGATSRCPAAARRR